MNSITIRKATISDREIIQKISRQTFIETFADLNTHDDIENYVQKNFNAEQVASELNNLESEFYIATLESETIAYLKLNFGNAQTEIRGLQSMEIQRIYVLKKYHGQKIGQLLLNEAILIGQHAGVDAIWLGVWEKNHKAIQFYNNNDFIEFDKHSFSLGNELQTDVLMELRIINQSNYL